MEDEDVTTHFYGTGKKYGLFVKNYVCMYNTIPILSPGYLFF